MSNGSQRCAQAITQEPGYPVSGYADLLGPLGIRQIAYKYRDHTQHQHWQHHDEGRLVQIQATVTAMGSFRIWLALGPVCQFFLDSTTELAVERQDDHPDGIESRDYHAPNQRGESHLVDPIVY